DLLERVGLPGIAGEILAGILIGPSVMNWVAPNETIRALSDLGVLFLLFSIGLDVQLADLLRVGLLSTLVATLGEAVPFLAGWGILLAWGGTAHAALFLGAALVATSVGISASVLKRWDLLRHPASQIILAAAVIDDVLGLIVLAVASGVTELLVPFFLAGIGLNFDVGIFRSRSTVLMALVMLLAAIARKVIGCGLATLSVGWQTSLRVGLGMIPRGEVAMVAAQLGL